MIIKTLDKSAALKLNRTRSFCIIFLLGFLMTSCLKDVMEIKDVKFADTWQPGVAVPLLNANLSISDILKAQKVDSLFQIDQDNFMTIIYQSRIFKAYLKDYIRIPKQKFYFSPLGVSGVPGDSAVFLQDIDLGDSKDFSFNFFNSAEIKTLKLKEGKLALSYDIDFQKPGYLVIEIPALTKGGKIFLDSQLFNNSSFHPITITDTVSLEGYSFDLTKNGSTTNSFNINFRMRLIGSSTYIHKNDQVKASAEFSQCQFSYIEGFLGKYDLNYPLSTMALSLFKSVETARLFFENPKLDILINNSAGLPVVVDSFALAMMAKDSSTVQMAGQVINQPYQINYPSINEVGQTKFTGIYANKSNSNIDQMISILPQSLQHDFRLFINPGNKTYDNFATDSSYVSLGLNLEFPLYGHTKDWLMQINTPFETGDISMIKEIEFNLMVSNEFPMEGDLQVYFLDSNSTILDSLIDSKKYIIPSGIAGGDGKTIMPGYTLTKILFPFDRLQNIQDSKEFQVEIRLATSDQGAYSVKFYSTYHISFKMSMRVKAEPNAF